MKQMHLRVDDALYEELNTYSVETEQSMQACVREAVAYYITDKKKKQIPVLKSQFTFIDLFAGIGGMRLAYENVGGRCVYSNEWNKYSQQTYYANFGEQPEGDITKVDAKTILESLDELKYKVFFAVLDGQNFVPQHRERIIIVGFDMERYGDDIEFDFDITPVNPKPVMRDILEKKVDDKYTLSDNLWTYLQNYAAKHRAAGNGFGYGIAPLDGVSRTISARYHKDGSEILIAQKGKNPRRLTPRECARLQGFPESFVIPVSDTQAYRQFGNSVVVPLIENVAKLIVEKIDLLESDVQNVKRKAI